MGMHMIAAWLFVHTGVHLMLLRDCGGGRWQDYEEKSNRCKSPLPWGALHVKWPEDTEREEAKSFAWVVLKPADFNRDVHLG